MKRFVHHASAFSLVEVTLALGVAAFCLIAVMGMLPVGLKTQQASVNQTKANAVISQVIDDLRADVRLPPGQASKAQGVWANLNGHWANVATPDTLYFTNEGKQTTVLTDAAFRATITYLFPPNASTSVAEIIVSWPATGVSAGSVETFIAVNR